MVECPLFIWKIYKYFLHLFTGTSEIERICHNYELNSHDRTRLIEQSINRSTKLDSVKRAMIREFDPQMVAMMIVEIKHMNQEILAFESTVLPNLVAALEPLGQVQTLRSKIDKLKNEPYNVENDAHEEKLELLWDNLRPNVRRSARHTSEWGEIGFQGKDPSSDFRGMGILGLENLLYLAENHQESAQIILRAANTKYKYPFAITGINLTSQLVNLLNSGSLKNYFYYTGSTYIQFNELYVKVFIEFNEFYQSKRPENVMQFGPILKEYMTSLKTRLEREGQMEW